MPDGNSEHIRTIIVEAVKQANELAQAEAGSKTIPTVLKWLAGIAGVLVGAAVIAYFNWLTGSVNQMQVTLARMDERQASQVLANDNRYEGLDRRVTALESYHREGNGR